MNSSLNPELTRIVHLGLGRFHRAHQAAYFQRLKNQGVGDFQILSFSMRSKAAADEMRALNHRYSILERSATEKKSLPIEIIGDAAFILEDRQKWKQAITDPQVHFVTLTVTEKGYNLLNTGELDLQNQEIKRDLNNPDSPQTTIGLLALGLHERQRANAAPISVLSCDNLQENGRKLENAVLTYAALLGWTDTVEWLKEKVTFPNSMVDRIVPAPVGRTDSSMIQTEIFSQWAIEDHFPFSRPPWDKAGVQFVSDILPFEEMKLCLLNAAHSFLAYGGLLHGHEFVHQAVLDTALRIDIHHLMNSEVIPVLTPPENFDLQAYVRDLITRFENPHLNHRLAQVAMDGSQKLPQRIFPSLLRSYALAAHSPENRRSLTKTVAHWLKWIEREISAGRSISDPRADTFKKLRRQNPGHWISEALNQADLFGELASQPAFKTEVLDHFN